jgi:hypothetical protein
MVSNERAEKILRIFQCEPGDIIKFIAAEKLTIDGLEYLLNQGEGDEEIKNRIRQELIRRCPGRMSDLLRYFRENRERFGDPEITAINQAIDLTWNALHKVAVRWSWQDILNIDRLPQNESLIFCSLIWEPESHLRLKDSSHRFLYVNAALQDFKTKIPRPYPYTNVIEECKTPEGEYLKAAFEEGLSYLEQLG